ncbi:hypothetical protein FOCC_FOCC016148 [Frankliniella occidentalis]|nr:hypothetical protein FOCC_FOCC016148 [Frankliniella occidentalis]
MEGLVQRPGPVNLKGGNAEAEWRHFLQKFEICLIAVNKKDAASDVQWALLMGEAGDQALHVYNSFKDKLKDHKVIGEDGTITTEDRSQTYVDVLAEFAKCAKEKKSVIGCREAFRKRNQRPKEPFSNWLTDLRILAKPCEFGTQELEDSVLRDRLVLGSANGRLKRDLLGTNLTLCCCH